MQWLYNQWYTHQYYKITEEGEQVSIYDSKKAHYILHIKNEGQLYYHFIVPGESYDIQVPYEVLGLSVELDRPYLLPFKQFMIKGNQIGSTVFMKWLCRYYLGISFREYWEVHCIDEDANIYSGNILYVENTLKKDIK